MTLFCQYFLSIRQLQDDLYDDVLSSVSQCVRACVCAVLLVLPVLQLVSANCSTDVAAAIKRLYTIRLGFTFNQSVHNAVVL